LTKTPFIPIMLGMNLTMRNTVIFSLLILAAITCITYWPALDNGFATRDEYCHIVHNQCLRVMTWQNLATLAGTHYYRSHGAPCAPLVSLINSLEYQRAGLNPELYHGLNLILHLLNVLLLCHLLYLLTQSLPVSVSAALLFAIHPALAEAVACTEGTGELLITLFSLLAILAYTRCMAGNGRHYYALSLGLFIMAAASSPWALILPFLLLAFDYGRDGCLEARHLRRSYPFFVISLACLVLLIETTGCLRGGRAPLASTMPFFYNLCSSSALMVKILTGFFIPSCPFHTCAKPPFPGLSPLLLALVMLMFIAAAGRSRKIIVPGIFFFAGLVPSLNILCLSPQQSTGILLYFPSIGLFMLGGFGFQWLLERARAAGRLYAAGAVILALSIVSLLAVHTHACCSLWKNSESIALAMGEKSGGEGPSPARPGAPGRDREAMEKRIDASTEEIARKPARTGAYIDRAMLFSQAGNAEEALADLDEAIHLDPSNAQAFFIRAMVYRDLQDRARALDDLNRHLKLEPLNARGYNIRAIMMAELGKEREALADFSQALEVMPGCEEALVNRGTFYARKGEHALALADFDAALKYNPRSLPALYRRAALLHVLKDDKRSGKDLERITKESGTMDWKTLQQLAGEFEKSLRR
jgi:protein O-mannosyl-transferase